MDTQEFRLATLYEVINDLNDAGKTELQKLVYFLQEAFDFPTSYPFRMHHYGPYAEDLDTDMTRLKLTGYVSIDHDTEGYGFHVRRLDPPAQGWPQLVAPYKERINQVIGMFGNKPTSDLELAATIHFVKGLMPNQSDEMVLETVRTLKPRFEPEYISNCYAELKEKSLLE